MKKIVKTILGVLLITVVVTIITICIKIAMDGCWIVFFPIDEKVETVTIEYPKLTQEPKEIIAPEDIERCVNMLNMLNYDMLKKSEDESDMLVNYTYHLKDGTVLVVSANNETVLYKGKRHVLKEEKLFVKVTEALFFLKEIAE